MVQPDSQEKKYHLKVVCISIGFMRGKEFMDEDLDQALQAEVLAAALRMDRQASGDLLEALAIKLSGSLPENTLITRGGWFLSSKRPVQELTVRFDEAHYQIQREKHGSFSARIMKVVRGVTLKTTDVPLDHWFNELAGELTQLAEHNKTMRQALQKFVIG